MGSYTRFFGWGEDTVGAAAGVDEFGAPAGAVTVGIGGALGSVGVRTACSAACSAAGSLGAWSLGSHPACGDPLAIAATLGVDGGAATAGGSAEADAAKVSVKTPASPGVRRIIHRIAPAPSAHASAIVQTVFAREGDEGAAIGAIAAAMSVFESVIGVSRRSWGRK